MEKESEKREKGGKKKVQKVQKVSKSGGKVETWGSSQHKMGKKAEKGELFQNCASLSLLSP